MASGYIAVFDSGVGGVSVARHLRRLLPLEDMLYYGDDANAPYGKLSTERVRALSFDAAEFLLSRFPVKALVVACNTATSAAIGALREAYPKLVIVGIEPALKTAAERFPGGHIGIMATDVTLREEKLNALMSRFEGQCRISRIAAPGLVELVEQGLGESDRSRALLEPVLTPYRGRLDALVLGCTHYPFAQNTIGEILGERTLLLDGAEGTARQTRRRLADAGLLRTQGDGGTLRILHSGTRADFAEQVEKLMK